jgi:hypothetical protein
MIRYYWWAVPVKNRFIIHQGYLRRKCRGTEREPELESTVKEARKKGRK